MCKEKRQFEFDPINCKSRKTFKVIMKYQTHIFFLVFILICKAQLNFEIYFCVLNTPTQFWLVKSLKEALLLVHKLKSERKIIDKRDWYLNMNTASKTDKNLE